MRRTAGCTDRKIAVGKEGLPEQTKYQNEKSGYQQSDGTDMAHMRRMKK